MIESPRMSWKYKPLAYTTVTVAWVAYAVLTLLAPEAANTNYHLSLLSLFLLRLTIIVPVHLIWLLALYGTISLRDYAGTIIGSPESRGLTRISSGLIWLLAGFILSPLLAAIMPFVPTGTSHDLLIIVRDHLLALLSLTGFIAIYRGAHELKNNQGLTTWSTPVTLSLLPYAIFSAIFAREFHQAAATPTKLVSRTSASIMPESILIFTLVFPYLSSWLLGILGCISILKYAHGIKGVIYRRGLQQVSIGISLVVVFSISSQILALLARFIIDFELLPLLGIIYVLLCLYGGGFIFIRSGAKKLRRIEEAK